MYIETNVIYKKVWKSLEGLKLGSARLNGEVRQEQKYNI